MGVTDAWRVMNERSGGRSNLGGYPKPTKSTLIAIYAMNKGHSQSRDRWWVGGERQFEVIIVLKFVIMKVRAVHLLPRTELASSRLVPDTCQEAFLRYVNL